MLRRPKIANSQQSIVNNRSLSVRVMLPLLMACVAALVLLAGSVAAAKTDASRPSTVDHRPMTSQTKWDAGQKDLLTSMEAEAADQSKANKPKDTDEPIYVTALSFIFKLVLVAGLAYGTIWVLKRLNVQSLKRSNDHTIRVVENTTLAANRSLHLVEVGTKRLLVASTPGQISLLTEVDSEQPAKKDAVVSTIPGSTETNRESTKVAGTSPNFKEQLTSYLGTRFLGTVGSNPCVKPDDTARRVAQEIRDTSSFLQDKVLVVAGTRKGFRDA